MSPACRNRWTTFEVTLPEGSTLEDMIAGSKHYAVIRVKLETFKRGLEHITGELFR